jgi:hypothetical protein
MSLSHAKRNVCYCHTLSNVAFLQTDYVHEFPDSSAVDKSAIFHVIKCFRDTESTSDKECVMYLWKIPTIYTEVSQKTCSTKWNALRKSA